MKSILKSSSVTCTAGVALCKPAVSVSSLARRAYPSLDVPCAPNQPDDESSSSNINDGKFQLSCQEQQTSRCVQEVVLKSLSLRASRAARKLRCSLRILHHTFKNQRQRNMHSYGLAGAPLLGMTMPVVPGDPMTDLLANHTLMAGFWAWFMAQFGKIFTKRFKTGVWDIRAVVQPGGMPSSHSSLCSGVTTAVALQYGLASPLFAVCLAFSVIVMYDAMGVRQHAGKQAEVLNQVIDELMKDHPVVGDIKLKEVLGHTPRQVACGATLGVIVAYAYFALKKLA